MRQPLNVFVYGTLKPGEANYTAYCAEKVIKAIKAYAWGEIYHLRALGYPAMTQGNNKIQGYLLIFEDRTVLSQMDILETYNSQGRFTENEYYRVLIEVYNPKNHQSLGRAWVYLMDIEKVKAYRGESLTLGVWFGHNYCTTT